MGQIRIRRLVSYKDSESSWSSLQVIQLRPLLRREVLWSFLCGRFSEPLHLNLMAALVKLFGSYRAKVAFDVTQRHHYAYCTLRAADEARRLGLRSLTVVEFGVAAGAGLLALCDISRRVTACTGIEISVVGFDTGKGLPAPGDYRDHPELYQSGDYPMDPTRLRQWLGANATLILGNLKETIPAFTRQLDPVSPVGFAAIDVDYYSSTCDALRLFMEPDAAKYLPRPALYLDDINQEAHNSWCGELLALREFNRRSEFRKIEADRFIRERRLFKRGSWLDKIYLLHVLDHPALLPLAARPLKRLDSSRLAAVRGRSL